MQITLELSETKALALVIDIERRAEELEKAARRTNLPHSQAVCKGRALLLRDVARAISDQIERR